MAWYKTRFPIETEILLCHIEQTSQVVKMFFLHCKVNPIPTSKIKGPTLYNVPIRAKWVLTVEKAETHLTTSLTSTLWVLMLLSVDFRKRFPHLIFSTLSANFSAKHNTNQLGSITITTTTQNKTISLFSSNQNCP
ncbi:hypothetical protein MTR_5g023130 [Medicago truncatula]|uniref:Uncharacterized protein n=1 Tax=Medicago truncatula TaxID=3880 RepID=G7JYS8_MEDTR|nr:hypothetical protein MTR_5g023130 [Medicago truncatula]